MLRVSNIILGMAAALVVTGCSTMSASSPPLYQAESISEQKVTLAKQMAELWDRARIIPNIASSAPMISTHSEGLAEISKQNSANLKITGELLEALENRVNQRIVDDGHFDSVTLRATAGLDSIEAPPLKVFKGQRKAWPVISSDGEMLTLDVVWDEKGFLKIEQKELLLLQASFEHLSKKVEFPYYGGGILPLENINLELEVTRAAIDRDD